jgi:condensin complex subunit 3
VANGVACNILTCLRSEDLYSTLRQSILERMQDKEAAVRVQAVVAIGKLQKGEPPESVGSDEAPLIDVLCEVLQYDTSA